MELLLILGLPIILALSPLCIRDIRHIGIVNTAGYGFILFAAILFANRLFCGSMSFLNFFYADALSGFFVLLIAIVSFFASLYSIEYVNSDFQQGVISKKESRLYYVIFNLFVDAMFFSTVVNNLGIVWVSIEMTTLVSAFLVGFYNNEKAVEAAWKYIIICSVGIGLALFGTILYYYSISTYTGIKSLNWTDMVSVASKLDSKVLKIAFIFILVGYGTKAGIAPMHTWLPDAHSQSPSPISALLSGALLKTSIYAILRFMIILNKSAGHGYSNNLLIFFGILSIVISAVFILIQKDLKRLLAYSSIEHIGIILAGIGIGGPLGLYGALFHMLNHAASKSLMFFGAGNIVKKYKTHDMRLIRGIMQSMPLTGFIVILGAFALAGSPPFSIFMSEIMILIAGFKSGAYISTGILLFFISIIFGAIIYHFSKIVFGKKPDDMPLTKNTFSTKLAFIFLLGFVVLLGVNIPDFLDKLINSSVEIIK